MIGKLIINGVSVPVKKEIPVSVNLAIADIKDPDKRGGSTTKTIIIPRTPESDELFDNIFDVNIELSTFDPNVKIEATYYLNELEQFVGDLQLLKYKDDNGLCDYECSIVGREAGIFVAVGDSLLTDLDFSDLDHTFNKTEQKNSWDTSYRKSGVATPFAYGEGYAYGHIHYGYTNSDTAFDVNHFKPAIALREYLLRIYAAQGYTWNTGGFLDSNLIKHLYIPCNRDKIELSNSAISNSQYYVGKTTSASAVLASGNTAGNTAAQNNIAVYPEYDLETGSYFDASNQYDEVTTFIATVGFSGVYKIVAYCQLDVTINSASLPGGTWNASSTNYDSYIEINTGSGWVVKAAIANPSTASTQAIGASKSYKSSCQTIDILLTAGTQIRVRSRIAVTATLFDAGASPAPNNTPYTMDYVIPNGAGKNEHYLLRTDTSVYDGNTLTMNNAIPVNIKQKDLLKSVIQMFNIYSEKDKDFKDSYVQETRNDFFTGTPEIWTDKLDYSKSWESYPMKELDAINYVWKYKDDKDYYNDLYQKQFQDNYGLKRHQVESDFIKGEKKTEVIFSPTPLVSNSSNNIICPHIYAKDGVNRKPVAHNIRLLYYDGLKNSGNAWTYTSLSGTTSETQYAYMGHVDDPLAPTIDLNFSYPQQVYYTYPLAFYSTNNLYNAYYSQFINEITDKDSKIIVCYIRLDEVDIKNFSFRNTVFIRHDEYGAGYYIVNKIIDYDPLTEESTKVELLKLKNYSAFVPSSVPIDIGSETAETFRIAYNPVINDYLNSDTGNTLALGDSNRVMGAGCTATGTGNYIDESSSRVNLIGCTNCSAVGVTDFTGIGLSNRTITSDDDGTTEIGTELSDKLIGAPYTPTLTNVTNVSASTAYPTQYSRVGRVITVSGQIEIDPTAAGAFEVGISLPVASDIQQVYHCTGTCVSSDITDSSAYIKGDVANDRASLNGTAVNVASHLFYYVFTYRVI